MIYLDNAASTQVHEDVFQEMMPYFKEQYGNPSSIHRYGRLASKAIEAARKRIADLINAKQNEILLTSGGTESNNTALFGVMRQNRAKQLITSHIEHDAILEPCKQLAKEGFDVVYLPVNSYGMVDIEKLKHSITKETALVSVMFANNEVGTIQPIKEIAQICKQHNV
ncbi:MAG TPA: aminotransferase class V-fold PLP-dependent enzyme, partial [Candidatus Nitrosotenuis sp.]